MSAPLPCVVRTIRCDPGNERWGRACPELDERVGSMTEARALRDAKTDEERAARERGERARTWFVFYVVDTRPPPRVPQRVPPDSNSAVAARAWAREKMREALIQAALDRSEREVRHGIGDGMDAPLDD